MAALLVYSDGDPATTVMGLLNLQPATVIVATGPVCAIGGVELTLDTVWATPNAVNRVDQLLLFRLVP